MGILHREDVGHPAGPDLAGLAAEPSLPPEVPDENALERPTFYARGAELVRVLDSAENARQAGSDYESKVQGAVQDFASLLSDPTRGRVTGGRRALQVSDLHDNRFALDSLTDYARGKPVFFTISSTAATISSTGRSRTGRVTIPA